MRYATATAFRQALDDRLKAEAARTGLGVARLRRRVAFELLLRRLVTVAPDRFVLKGALALDFRFHAASRATRDMDLGRADDEDAVVEDFGAAQELVLDDFFTFAVRRTDALDDADDFRAIRFHVTAQLAGRTFDQFVVDVGFSESIAGKPDMIETSDLLSFAGIGPIQVPALPLAQHLAEKLHAYTRKHGPSGRDSTRPRTSSTSSSWPAPNRSRPPTCAQHSRPRSANASSSGCRRTSRRHPRAGSSHTADSRPAWTSRQSSTGRLRQPPSSSTQFSTDVPTARGILGAGAGSDRIALIGGKTWGLWMGESERQAAAASVPSMGCALAAISGARSVCTSGSGMGSWPMTSRNFTRSARSVVSLRIHASV